MAVTPPVAAKPPDDDPVSKGIAQLDKLTKDAQKFGAANMKANVHMNITSKLVTASDKVAH